MMPSSGSMTESRMMPTITDRIMTSVGSRTARKEVMCSFSSSSQRFAINKETNKKEYAVIDANGWITGQWIEETTENEVPAGLGTTLTTADDGTVTVKGLKAGDYYFKEVVAPDGYSINDKDIAFTMAETTDKTTGVVTGVAPTQPELIKMYDSKLSALPSTGGMGTTLFTIAGCAIMVAAAGFFFASRKRVNK